MLGEVKFFVGGHMVMYIVVLNQNFMVDLTNPNLDSYMAIDLDYLDALAGF